MVKPHSHDDVRPAKRRLSPDVLRQLELERHLLGVPSAQLTEERQTLEKRLSTIDRRHKPKA